MAYPAIVEAFLNEGAEVACEAALSLSGETVESELRRRRTALALAVALGDLARELIFERATRLLSDFADTAIDRALTQALTERKIPRIG